MQSNNKFCQSVRAMSLNSSPAYAYSRFSSCGNKQRASHAHAHRLHVLSVLSGRALALRERVSSLPDFLTLPYPTQFRRGVHEQEAELARAVADKAAVTHAMWQELRDKEADLGRALALGHASVRPSH